MSEDKAEYKAEYKTGDLVSGRQFAKIAGFKAPSYVAKLKKLGVLQKCFVKKKGKRYPLINVELALAEIEASADPAKDYVRRRWEQYRAGNQKSHASVTESERTGSVCATPAKDAVDDLGKAAPQVAGTTTSKPPLEGEPSSGQASGQTAALNKSEEQGQNNSHDQGAAGAGPHGEPWTTKRTYADEKTEQAKVDTELKRIKLLELAGDLVKAADVRAAVLKVLGDVRDKVMALPDRLHRQLAAETEQNAVHAILDQECRKALDELADEITGPQHVADHISAGQRH